MINQIILLAKSDGLKPLQDPIFYIRHFIRHFER